MPEITDRQQALVRLRAAKTIAVLGVSANVAKPAHYVPAYLVEQGYRIIPVNPRYKGQVLFGETVRASLAEIDEPVHLVDVFRRAEDLQGHVDELIALGPELVWFQLGIRNDAVTKTLVDAGLDVVQDRCTLALLRSAGPDLGA
ncbi:MAG: CoA-binding protein [Myxococcota bacterium]